MSELTNQALYIFYKGNSINISDYLKEMERYAVRNSKRTSKLKIKVNSIYKLISHIDKKIDILEDYNKIANKINYDEQLKKEEELQDKINALNND